MTFEEAIELLDNVEEAETRQFTYQLDTRAICGSWEEVSDDR